MRKNARIDAAVLQALRLNPEGFIDFAMENPFESATHPLEAARILNWPKFLVRWEKLEKLAKKLGVDVGYEEVGEDFEPVDPRRPMGARHKVRLVQVWGDAPQINGWEFLARIDNLDQTHATVAFAPGKETLVDPALWQAGTNCDHCRLTRYRTRRYALRCIDHESPDYGRIMVVGATCMKDFLGHDSPQTIAMIASYLEDLDTLGADPDGGGSSDPTTYYYGVNETMPIVASLTTKLGFVSSKMETLGKPSTATTLLYFLTPPRSEQARKDWVEFRKEMAPTPEDQKLAADTIAWAQGLEGTSGYEMNIRAIASAENIGYRQMGLFASMVYAYLRARDEIMRKQREREGRGESAHVGVVGERTTFDLTLRKTIELESVYGTSYLYLFVTPEGYDVAWKASKKARFASPATGYDEPIREGHTYRVQARVKEHGDYKGRPQTKIERAKILAQL